MDLCVCESKEDEYAVGSGVNSTLMSETLLLPFERGKRVQFITIYDG